MTEQEWSNEETRKIAELVKGIDICMLVTCADGQMRGRPMSNNGNVEYDGDTWFFSARDSAKVDAIRREPRVELAYLATDQGVWVSIEGRAEIVDDDRRKRDLWQDELRSWFATGPEDDDVVLVRVAADRVHAWAQGEELVIEPGKGVLRVPQDQPA